MPAVRVTDAVSPLCIHVSEATSRQRCARAYAYVWTRAEEKEGEAECVGVRTAVLERMSQWFFLLLFFFKEGTGQYEIKAIH